MIIKSSAITCVSFNIIRICEVYFFYLERKSCLHILNKCINSFLCRSFTTINTINIIKIEDNMKYGLQVN